MSDPINYSAGLTPANPSLAFQQGLGQAQGIQQMFDARAQLEAQKQQAAMTEALRQKVVSGQATGAERADFLTRLAPEQTKAYQGALQSMDAEAKQQGLAGLGKIYSAFAAGNSEVGVQGLQERATALRNSGNDEGAKLLETAIEMEKTQPGQGSFFVANQLALLGKDGQDLLDSINNNLKAPYDRAYLDAQIKKILSDLKDAKGLPPDKRFQFEQDLAMQYKNLTAPRDALQATYASMVESGASKTGQGDYALITQFVKMLDPTSVVRESEFAQASDTAGMVTQLMNTVTKLATGGKLTDDQRNEYLNLAKKYLDSTDKLLTNREERIKTAATNYGLDLSNIIPQKNKDVSPSANSATPPVTVKFGTTTTKPTTTTAPKKTVEVDF